MQSCGKSAADHGKRLHQAFHYYEARFAGSRFQKVKNMSWMSAVLCTYNVSYMKQALRLLKWWTFASKISASKVKPLKGFSRSSASEFLRDNKKEVRKSTWERCFNHEKPRRERVDQRATWKRQGQQIPFFRNILEMKLILHSCKYRVGSVDVLQNFEHVWQSTSDANVKLRLKIRQQRCGKSSGSSRSVGARL